MFKYFCVE